MRKDPFTVWCEALDVARLRFKWQQFNIYESVDMCGTGCVFRREMIGQMGRSHSHYSGLTAGSTGRLLVAIVRLIGEYDFDLDDLAARSRVRRHGFRARVC